MTSIRAWNLCVCMCVTVCFVSAAVVRKENLFPLDIIHYNDFHDRFEETSVEFPICSTNDTKCIGGFPRLYREIKTLLKEKPEALVLDAGDAFQGTYWFTLLKWNVTQHFINMIPNDAHTLGNHEFDNGVEGLTPYLAALRAPVVVANIDTTQEPTLKGLYKPHIIVERHGRRIGIIGVITPETQGSSRTGKVIFTDPIKAVKDEAQSLADDGVDIIIVLSHCGIKVDKQMAKIAGDNVDIIVGGHSHSLLWNDKLAPSKEPIVGPYPVIVKSQDKHGHQVLVVTASAFSKYLGNITAYFNDEGDLVSFDGKPVHLDRSIPEDPEIKALMQPYTEKLHGIVNKVVGKSETDLVDIPCGAGECDIGNLVADSMLAAAKKYDPSDLPAVAFLYRSAIRGSIPTGDITRGSIINVLPFGNKLATVTIKGRYIFEALNLGLSKAWVLKPFKGPWMPQVAGMKLIANTTSQKVETVEIKHRDGFQPLKMDEDYQLTSTDFQVAVANTTLKENGRNVKFIGVDFELFEEYVTEISPITNQLDKRLVVVT